MITFNSTALLLGFTFGALLGVCFFASLAFSVRLALRSSGFASMITLSAIFRISLLLAAGYYVVMTIGNAWALLGVLVAFLLVRLLATAWAYAGSVNPVRVKEAG